MNIPLILITYTAGLSVIGIMIYTVLRGGSTTAIHRIYYIAGVLDLSWCFSYLAMYLIADPDTAAIAYRAGSAGWTVNFAFLFLLSMKQIESISERRVSPVPGYCMIASSLVFLAAALSGRIFATGFIRTPGGWWAEQVNAESPWVMAFILWALLAFLLGMLPLFSMLKRARLKRHRRHILFIFSPLVAVTILAICINLLFPLFGTACPPLGHIVVSFYITFIGYGIVKFRMTTPAPEIIADPLLFQISDMVVLTDGAGKILRTNHAVSDLLGYKEDDLVSKSASVLLPNITPLHQGTGEREARTSAGTKLPVHCAINPIDDVHGDRIGFFILLKDLTRLKKLEQLTGFLRATNLELERLSITDSLTGMYNRSKTEDVLNREILRCRRYGSSFSVILYDIDHFKDINDSHGHAAGDSVLRLMSDAVRQGIRETDILGRWGGEEFLIICVNTDREAAGLLAEKIRAHLETVEHEGIGRVTASFGVTEYAEDDSPDSIIARVDRAMYDSKRRGRNLTTVL